MCIRDRSLPIDSEKLFNTPIGSLVEGGILDKFFPPLKSGTVISAVTSVVSE